MKVYLDANSSTKVFPEVVEAIIPYLRENIAPPSSDYGISAGVEAKSALDESRKVIAEKLSCNINEIVFTSGQAESNNLAIKGIAFANMDNDSKNILALSTSHSSIIDSLEGLKLFGFNYHLINVDQEGFIKLNHLEQLIKEHKPILVSVPHGNVEIGTINDIETVANICKEYNIPLHVEASYSFCKIPLDASKYDLVTVTSHFVHGPKGIGVLKVNKKVKLRRLIDGGLQENRKRGGTENIPGIVGFATAVKLYKEEYNQNSRKLRDYLWEEVKNNIQDFQITGTQDKDKRLPNHFSAVFNFVEGESILLHLDLLGYMIATGSACSSKKLEASHVLTAIGLPTEVSHGSVRIGISYDTKREDLVNFTKSLLKVVTRLREMSPVDEEFMKEYEHTAQGQIEEDDNHHHDLEEMEEF